jgi:16S rRNA (guanine527-N7)-methyltransferase
MRMQPNHRIDPVSLSTSLSLEFPDLDREVLERYLAEIVRWNRALGLVSKRSTEASLKRLVRQSVGLWSFLARECDRSRDVRLDRVVDIGSGAGFPGLVWKLLCPQITVVLVERRERKVLFLERVRTILRLEGIEIASGDAAELVERQTSYETFDVAVTMAVGSPAAIASTVERFLRDSGYYCTVRPKEEEIPDRIGAHLELAQTLTTDSGCYCLYRKGARRQGVNHSSVFGTGS